MYLENTSPNGLRRFFFVLIGIASLALLSCSDSGDDGDDPTPSFEPVGMVKIECGGETFVIGSTDGLPDEAPTHNVTLSHNIWMDTTEVTQSAYDALMIESYAAYTSPVWNNPYGVGASHPVYNVYWSDAVLFCNAQSRRDGLDSVYTYTSITGVPGNGCELVGVAADLSKNGYRLPTEAEWEYAARGDDSHDFPWGKDYDPYPESSADSTEFNAHCVWTGNSYSMGSETTAFGTQPVGGKLPNGYGLYDMAGNVYEWCHDWYGEYTSAAQTDPTGATNGGWHVMRGGSWGSHALHQRVTNRTFSVPDYEYYFIGFRTVTLAD